MLKNCNISLRSVALEMGIKPNSANTFLTQVEAGRTKLPSKWIAPLCNLLEADPVQLIMAILRESDPMLLDLLLENDLIKKY